MPSPCPLALFFVAEKKSGRPRVFRRRLARSAITTCATGFCFVFELDIFPSHRSITGPIDSLSSTYMVLPLTLALSIPYNAIRQLDPYSLHFARLNSALLVIFFNLVAHLYSRLAIAVCSVDIAPGLTWVPPSRRIRSSRFQYVSVNWSRLINKTQIAIHSFAHKPLQIPGIFYFLGCTKQRQFNRYLASLGRLGVIS